MFKFNLERAQRGAQLVTRNGQSAIYGGFNNNALENSKISGWVHDVLVGWTEDGVFINGRESDLDLFMVTPNPSRKYVNLHKDEIGEWMDEAIYDDIEMAKYCATGCDSYVKTIEIKL